MNCKLIKSIRIPEGNVAKIKDSSGNILWKKDTFEYDYVMDGDFDEIDILYTTDIHTAWYGSGRSGKSSRGPVFKLTDVGNYKDKLFDNGIPAFCVDCGDITLSGSTAGSDEIINMFNNLGTKGYTKYLGTTYGNHEWKFGSSSSSLSFINRLKMFSACNFFNSNGTLAGTYNKPYRTAKIGNVKLAVIGIGYPSANGSGSYNSSTQKWSYDGYTFYDSVNNASTQQNRAAANTALYKEVQKHIDYLKGECGFDYVFVFTHMDRYAKENFDGDSRFFARSEFLIYNTSGLDGVIPGHWNQWDDRITFTDKSGRNVQHFYEAGASMDYIGRIRINIKNHTIDNYLLDDRGDLNYI